MLVFVLLLCFVVLCDCRFHSTVAARRTEHVPSVGRLLQYCCINAVRVQRYSIRGPIAATTNYYKPGGASQQQTLPDSCPLGGGKWPARVPYPPPRIVGVARRRRRRLLLIYFIRTRIFINYIIFFSYYVYVLLLLYFFFFFFSLPAKPPESAAVASPPRKHSRVPPHHRPRPH